MKKRWRWIRSSRSPDRTSPPSGSFASPPSGSGEPASPPCQSLEPTSPDRCGGEGTSSAPALFLDREGGDECLRNRPKQRRKKGNRHFSLILDDLQGDRHFSLIIDDLQGEVCSVPTPGKKAGKRLVSKTGKRRSTVKRCSPRRLGLHVIHTSSQSVAAQGKSSFDEEETSSGLKSVAAQGKSSFDEVETSSGLKSVAAQGKSSFDEEETSSGLKVEKPKPSSVYHGKISLDEYEDGQSDKTPSVDNEYEDALDEYEDGQSDKTPSVDDEYEDGQSDTTPSVNLSKTIAQDEEISCDGGETSSQVMVEKKPKPSSGHHGKIAQEQDGYSGKTPPSMDLIKMIAQDEDGQHSKKIGVHDIEEYKQEQGRARVYAKDLLDVDDETISKNISYFSKMLNYDSPERYYCPEYEPEELIELYERLALYRIRAYELTVNGNLAALDDMNLKQQYPPSKLYDEGFFKHYEESLEWYFDPKLCKHAHFDDYQRITLRSPGYLDWDFYHSTLNTYEEDLAYVQYSEVLANEIKWIEDHMGGSAYRWNRIQDVVYIQALDIAVGFPNVSPLLVSYGYTEHICSMWFDHSHKGMDALYFEIWKRVAKGKMSFREALLEVHSKDMFPSLSVHIKLELECGHHLKDFYDAHVAGIDKMASDDKALELITEAFTEMFPRNRFYLDYAKKKLDIAKDIGLISIGRRREVALQDNGENGQEKVNRRRANKQ